MISSAGAVAVIDKTIWHKCATPLWPRRLIDGTWSTPFGQAWRRRRNDRWEYRQDDETVEDFCLRAW